MPNIGETAVGAGSFTTLKAAVRAAGLVDTLIDDILLEQMKKFIESHGSDVA